MKLIKLYGVDDFALVDDEDYEYLSQFTWYKHIKGYAYGRINRTRVYMHKFINKTPDGFVTDHINHNKLDNRKSNLRTCTYHQNQANRVLNVGKSGYRGVTVQPNGKFRSMIRVDGKKIGLGVYETAREAARVYNDYAYIHYGEFAILNK